jgi:hypothetical protein
MPGLVVLLHLNPRICGMFVLKSRNKPVAKKRDKVNLAVKSWDELQTELYPGFECKLPGFKCNCSAVKDRKFVENKHRSFRDLSAA